MTRACPIYWEGYQCDWTIGYLWRWMHWTARLDVVLLGTLLAYVVAIVVYVSSRTAHGEQCPRSPNPGSESSLRELICGLNIRIRNLKTIAAIAPYMGLAGTCVGIIHSYRGFAMEKHAALAVITTGIGASFITSIAGVLVVPPAIWARNLLRVRLDRLEGELLRHGKKSGSSRLAQQLPLAPRFSTVPWMFIGAPILGIVILVFATFALYRGATGLEVRVASLRCDEQTPERVIVLRVAKDGKLFLNLEQESWDGLTNRLTEIYRMRVHRTIYVSADDDVRFQALADAVDIAQSAGIDYVELITPSVMNSHCPDRVVYPQFSK